MRALYSLSVLAAAATEAVQAQTPATSARPIFRQITFQPFAPITLGEPLPQRAPRTIAVRPGRVALALQSFGDTDSIYVDQRADGTVAGLEFVYPATKDIAAAIADYRRLLGEPAHHVVPDSAGARVERWRWNDSATLFEFTTLRTSKAIIRVWSALRDHP